MDLIGIKIRAKSEVLRHTPKEDLLCDQLVPMDRGPAVVCECDERDHTLPSSDPDAIRSSLKGFLLMLVVCYDQGVHNSHCSPVGIEDHGSVTPEKRYSLRQLPALLQRNNSKCTSTTSFPVYGEVFGVGLVVVSDGPGRWWIRGGGNNGRTLTRLVSQAFLEIRRLS